MLNFSDKAFNQKTLEIKVILIALSSLNILNANQLTSKKFSFFKNLTNYQIQILRNNKRNIMGDLPF